MDVVYEPQFSDTPEVHSPRTLLSQWQTYLDTTQWQISPDPTQKYSDGEIYCRVRFCQLAELEYLQDEWMSCLSASKQRNLAWLLERTSYTARLDILIIFQGLWVGFEIGNIRQLFALRCDEEFHRYLSKIFDTWNMITLYDDVIKASVDIETVQRLQGRAPFASESDRRSVVKDMDLGLLFSKVTHIRTRQRILEAILGLDVIIATIKTFHENSKLLGIGVKVIRRELAPFRSGSLFESLRSMWSPQASCSLETREGVFASVVAPNNVDPAYLAYFQIFIAALRKFAKLGDDPPQRDIRSVPAQARLEPVYQTLFARRAKFLGFNSRQIQENCNLVDGELSVTQSPLNPYQKRKQDMKTRWGRPNGYAYAELERNLFIVNLARARQGPSRNPSAMFIQQDFLRAFFRPSVIYAQWVLIPRSIVDLTSPLPIDIRDNVMQHDPSPLGNITEAHQTPNSVPPSSINPFLAYREANTSPTTTSIYSQMSQHVSTSSSPMRDVHLSQVVEGLASQFVDTAMEIGSGDQVTQSQSSQRISVDSSPRVEFGQQMTSTHAQEQDLDRKLEHGSSNTTIVGNGDDSWVSEGSTVAASGDGDIDRSSIITPQARSYPELNQQTARASSSGLRLCDRPGSAIKQTRRDRRDQRSFLIANLRVNKRTNSRKRIGRFLGGKREAVRSFQITGRNGSEPPHSARSPKGKAILQNIDFIDDTRPGETSRPPDLLQSDRPMEIGTGRRAAAARSYLGLIQDGVEHYESRPGTRSIALSQRHEQSGSARNPTRQGRAARSYIRVQTESQSENYPSSTNGKEVVRFATQEESSVDFLEYNGMKLLPKTTTNLTEYLKRRKGWVGMAVVDSEPRTLRLDHIAKYMENKRSEDSHPRLILVKQPHAERFRVNYFR